MNDGGAAISGGGGVKGGSGRVREGQGGLAKPSLATLMSS